MYYSLIFTSGVAFLVLGMTISCAHRIQRLNESSDKVQSHIHEKNQFVSVSGRKVKDLRFFPINGFRFRLSELDSAKAVVIFLRDGNCPLSEKHGADIASLEKRLSKKNVQFIYVYTGRQNPKENAETDLKKFGFKGPYVIDSGQTAANALKAKTAGEVFVLTPDRRLIYSGPFSPDDEAGLFQITSQSKRYSVSAVLDLVIKGQKPGVRKIPTRKCKIARPVVKDRVFWEDTAPVIQKKCTICHNPSGSGPMDFMSYKDVAGRKAMFKYVIENDLMPPMSARSHSVSFRDEVRLTPYEKSLLIKWLTDGSKIKKKSVQNLQIPASPRRIDNPDYSITVPEIKIPAAGVVPVKQFIVKTRFSTNKWIKEMEFITKPKVLHHITFNICEKGKRFNNCVPRPRTGKYTVAGSSFGWAPGARKHEVFPDDTGIKIPKSAKIILYLHYEPVGREITDNLTEIRFLFHKHPPSKQLSALKLYDTSLKIPPSDSNYKSSLSYRVQNSPLILMGVIPHMHLRGKASSALWTDPTGKTNIFFNLDPWNFKSQAKYVFESPVTLPENSTLQCINWFDNSSDNIVNPNPKKTVLYGFREKDEMSMCTFYIVLPLSDS